LIAADRTAAWDEVTHALQAAGFECEGVADAAAPAEVVTQLLRGGTVLIVDLAHLPSGSTTLVTTCRRLAREAPVVVVAPNPSIELARRLRASGVFYLALAPVTADEMRSAVVNAFDCLERHRAATSSLRAKSRVLVVDDDADFVTSVSALLESQGYEVSAARSAREAIEMVRAHPPDLIVLDIMMEYDSSGYEVNQAVKFREGFECARHVPVLMVSSIQMDPVERFRAAGELDMITPDGYMTKPVDIPRFLETVKGLLGERPDAETA
jgi:CheY-like chemotaxis protein